MVPVSSPGHLHSFTLMVDSHLVILVMLYRFHPAPVQGWTRSVFLFISLSTKFLANVFYPAYYKILYWVNFVFLSKFEPMAQFKNFSKYLNYRYLAKRLFVPILLSMFHFAFLNNFSKYFESNYGLIKKFCQNKYFSILRLFYAYNILFKIQILVHTHYGFSQRKSWV